MSARVWVGCASHEEMKKVSKKMTISLGGKDWLRILLRGCYSGLKIHHLMRKASGITLLKFSWSKRQYRKNKAAEAGTGTKVSDLGFEVTRYDWDQEKKPTSWYRAGVSKHIMLPELFLMASPREAAAPWCLSETHLEHKSRIWSTFQSCITPHYHMRIMSWL